MKTIPEILESQAAQSPNRIAIIDRKNEQLTFAELAMAVSNFAEMLSLRGFQKGDFILVFIPMSLELYVALLGILKLGAIAVFLDPSASSAHIDACCKIQPPKGFIGITKAFLLMAVSGELRRISIKIRVSRRWKNSRNFSGSDVQKFSVQPEDAALLTFTSGSTGTPKAALRSHQFLIAQYQALIDSIALKSGEVDLTTLPIFVLANLAAGVTSVLPDANMAKLDSIDPQKIAAQITRHGIKRTGGSPTFYEQLADTAESGENFLADLQKIYTGGAPVFPSLLAKLKSLAPHAKVVAVYGSTEAEPIAEQSFDEIEASDFTAMTNGSGLLAGKPIAEISLAIVEDRWGTPLNTLSIQEFATLNRAPHEIGEIVVSGEHVLKNYLKGKGDSETKFRVDDAVWHRTGDAGYLDKRGRLWLLGRCSAKVNDQKGKLYPFTVECVAMSFPFVKRAAFLLHHDQRVLIIEWKQSPSSTDVTALQQRLEWAKIDRIASIQKMPLDKRHHAKINYPELLKIIAKLKK